MYNNIFTCRLQRLSYIYRKLYKTKFYELYDILKKYLFLGTLKITIKIINIDLYLWIE